MTRFCLCLTGQLRAPDLALPALAAKLARRDVTVVFSVWDRVGRKVDGAMNEHQLRRVFDKEAYSCLPPEWYGAHNIWRALPLLHEDLRRRGGPEDAEGIRALLRRHVPGAVVDIESGSLLDLEFAEERDDRNSVRMLYKIWRANEIAKRLARETGGFDVVVRMRPDLRVDHLDFDAIAARVAAGAFLVDDWRGDYCADNFAAGTPAALDVYASTFARALARPQTWNNIHFDLAAVILAGGLRPERHVTGGFLPEPETVGPAALLDSLAAMEGGRAWTPLHAKVQAALRALPPRAGDAVTGASSSASPDRARSGILALLMRLKRFSRVP